VLGGMEVFERGGLANWMIPGKMVKGMGGAMDVMHRAKRVTVIMEHPTRAGESRVKRSCTLTLTGAQVASRLITDLAVFDFTDDVGMVLTGLQPGVALANVRAATDARFVVATAT
jgi:3-oxoacid CoA-transferase subunit B